MKTFLLLISIFGVGSCMGQTLDGRYVWRCSGDARQVLTLKGKSFTTELYAPSSSTNPAAKWSGEFSAKTSSALTFSVIREETPLTESLRQSMRDNCQWLELKGSLTRISVPASNNTIDLQKGNSGQIMSFTKSE